MHFNGNGMHFQGMVGGRVINKINVVVFLSEIIRTMATIPCIFFFFINAHLRMTIYEKNNQSLYRIYNQNRNVTRYTYIRQLSVSKNSSLF